MKAPASEYARFNYLAQRLFAVKKVELEKIRADYDGEKKKASQNASRAAGGFAERLRRFAMKATDKPTLQCSFCGKTAEQVQFLLAGGGNPPSVYICGGCVDISASIIEKTKASGTAPAAP